MKTSNKQTNESNKYIKEELTNEITRQQNGKNTQNKKERKDKRQKEEIK